MMAKRFCYVQLICMMCLLHYSTAKTFDGVPYSRNLWFKHDNPQSKQLFGFLFRRTVPPSTTTPAPMGVRPVLQEILNYLNQLQNSGIFGPSTTPSTASPSTLPPFPTLAPQASTLSGVGNSSLVTLLPPGLTLVPVTVSEASTTVTSNAGLATSIITTNLAPTITATSTIAITTPPSTASTTTTKPFTTTTKLISSSSTSGVISGTESVVTATGSSGAVVPNNLCLFRQISIDGTGEQQVTAVSAFIKPCSIFYQATVSPASGLNQPPIQFLGTIPSACLPFVGSLNLTELAAHPCLATTSTGSSSSQSSTLAPLPNLPCYVISTNANYPIINVVCSSYSTFSTATPNTSTTSYRPATSTNFYTATSTSRTTTLSTECLAYLSLPITSGLVYPNPCNPATTPYPSTTTNRPQSTTPYLPTTTIFPMPTLSPECLAFLSLPTTTELVYPNPCYPETTTYRPTNLSLGCLVYLSTASYSTADATAPNPCYSTASTQSDDADQLPEYEYYDSLEDDSIK